jgi:uncharacterized RDD family membrane protein YckC
MSDNPYASPFEIKTSYSTPSAKPDELKIASRGLRFANFFIDNIVTNVLSLGAGCVIGAAYGFSKVSANEPITPDDEATLNIVGFIVGIFMWLAYYVFMEAAFQRTLGKFVTGTRVVDASGGQPSLGQIIGRTFARIIPFEAFSFLADPVGWHDSLSGTRVIERR